MVANVRKWAEKIEGEYGKTDTLFQLKKKTNWANHAHNDTRYPFTLVDENHMDRTVDLLEEVIQDLDDIHGLGNRECELDMNACTMRPNLSRADYDALSEESFSYVSKYT